MIPNCDWCNHRHGAHYIGGLGGACSYTGCGCLSYRFPELVPTERIHRVTINRKPANKYQAPLTECVCICGWNFRQSRTWPDENAARETTDHFENVAYGKHAYLNAQ